MHTTSLALLLSVAALTGGCGGARPVAVLPDAPVSAEPLAPGDAVIPFTSAPRPRGGADGGTTTRGNGALAEAPLATRPASVSQPSPPRAHVSDAPSRPSPHPPLPTFEPPPSQPPVPRQPAAVPQSRIAIPIPPPATPGSTAAGVPAEAPTQGTQQHDPQFGSLSQRTLGTVTADGDALRRALLQRVKDHPADLTAHLNLQLFLFLKDEPETELGTLQSLPKEQRDVVVTLLDGLKKFRQSVQTDPNALPSRIVRPLLEMASLLEEQTELAIPTMALCRRVDGFGVYEPMDLTFRAGLDYETIIYCEIQNFSSRQQDDQWETKLSLEAVLYDSAGDAILKGKDQVPTDRCRNRRRDFFIVKRLRLPATLAASRYILKVTIVDEQTQRVAENTLNIMMMAQ